MPPGLISIYQYLIFGILAAPDSGVAVNSGYLEALVVTLGDIVDPGGRVTRMARHDKIGAGWQIYLAAFLALLSVAPFNSALADDTELLDELRRCSHLDGREVRDQCLNKLAIKVLREDRVLAEAAEIGESGSDTADRVAVDNKVSKNVITGVLLSCKKNSEGKYLFYLENGQIWKQVSTEKKRFGKCDGSITIGRDLLGHKMVRNDDGSSIRVRRLR